MKKMISGLLTTLVLLVALSPTILATSSPVIDSADLFTDSQEATLVQEAQSAAQEIGNDVAIITTSETYSGSRDYYLEDIYFQNGFSQDGIALHIDMSTRTVAVQAFGAVDNTMSVSNRDTLCDMVWDCLLQENPDFYAGAMVFADNTPDALDGTIGLGLSFVELLVVIPLAVILFCGIFFGVKLAYGSEGKERPYPFQERANSQLSVNQDRYVREYTTSVRVKSSNSSGGGPRHSSGRSSSSSSRRF